MMRVIVLNVNLFQLGMLKHQSAIVIILLYKENVLKIVHLIIKVIKRGNAKVVRLMIVLSVFNL